MRNNLQLQYDFIKSHLTSGLSVCFCSLSLVLVVFHFKPEALQCSCADTFPSKFKEHNNRDAGMQENVREKPNIKH